METFASTVMPSQKCIAELQGCSKKYPGVLALENVHFSLQPGEIRALLGKNGAGKSTLIRLLTGATIPDSGKVIIDGQDLSGSGSQRTLSAAQLGVQVVYQELSLVPTLSIAENIFLGRWLSKGGVLQHSQMAKEAAKTLERLELFLHPERKVLDLSPAERQLVEISRVLLGSPKLVILDEPTSALAAAEVERLFKAVRNLAQQGIALIYVSHRMKEIRQIAHTATIMRDGKIATTQTMDSIDTAQIVSIMLGHAEKEADGIIKYSFRDEKVLQISDISLAAKFHNLTFDLYRGEVLGIAGLLGSGRTELLQSIAGLQKTESGKILLKDTPIQGLPYRKIVRHGIGFTPESRKEDGIIPLLGVDENIVVSKFRNVAHFGVIFANKIKEASKKIIDSLDIKTTSTATAIGTLSGGNQQKVVIGRWVFAESEVLLLDEPTRGVDVEAKAQIYALIRKLASEGKSIIFVSSEIEELPRVCDRVLVLRNGSFVREFISPNIDAEELTTLCIS